MVTPLYGQSKTPGQNNYIPMLKEHFTEEKTHIAKKTNKEIFELPGGQRNTNQDHNR